MTLHARSQVRDDLLDSVFAGQDVQKALPRYRFPDGESRAKDRFQLVSDELELDGNARENLATFCQT